MGELSSPSFLLGEIFMAYDKSQIWRTYYKKRMNILGGAKNIHDAIFGSGKENISK